ncbi:MAG: UDP-N-acetylmuramoyl-tripeptide--D-alanyl-D-alanine ligase [Patescibacteria group bacterium]|nr:MAG: UDP-N-acetylmuramoyl-tripeptide--D-alanyl-D-alanine ligase [Patescibacteria group bacterium]
MKRKLGLVFLFYLRVLAKVQLWKVGLLRKIFKKPPLKIVGVTGSYGKTTTMLAIVSALKGDFKVKYTEKGNSESGIPLDILGLKMKGYSVLDWMKVFVLSFLMLFINWRDFDIYVVEMGVDEPKEPKNMTYLLKIIRPDIGVFIGVSSVHSQQFESVLPKNLNLSSDQRHKLILSVIADEKAKMIVNLPKDGFAVLNFEDKFVKERAVLTKAKVIPVKRVKIEFEDYILPDEFDINFGIAVSVASIFGIKRGKAISNIKKNFKLPAGRSSIIRGIKDTLIIDSSYNSSFKATVVMLGLLDKLGKKLKRKKVAVLGDMRELGNLAEREHKELAKVAVRIADKIILVGPLMGKYFLPQALKLGYPRENIKHFSNACLAAKFLKGSLDGGEIILVKGSQNTIFLEIVVEALMADRSQADVLLCRRGSYWESQRGMYASGV